MGRKKKNNRLILTVNCGSSSLKFKVFSFPDEQVRTKGLIEHIGEEGSEVSNHHQALELAFQQMFSAGVDRQDIYAVGHRVVHGGEDFIRPTRIDDQVIAKIRELFKLAPLHNPANLEGIIACKKLLPDVPQVAVFDTAFHSTIPERAYMYAIPFEYYSQYGVRRYGFHGTSHQYVSLKASELLKKPLSRLNLITCHLGNGCSITAVKGGKSVDTSMGFTPLEGLVMGTRSGDIDPALVIFLQRQLSLSPDEVDKVLNKESGLKGLSGVSNDFRDLMQARKKGNKRAGLAIEVFKYRLLKYIGAYALVLGRVDAIVFTGGIGEHVAEVRQFVKRAVKGLFKKEPKILVIPTDEELMIARQVVKVISRRGL